MIIIDNFIQKLTQQMLKYNNEKNSSSKYVMVLEKFFTFMVIIQLISIPLKIYADLPKRK